MSKDKWQMAWLAGEGMMDADSYKISLGNAILASVGAMPAPPAQTENSPESPTEMLGQSHDQSQAGQPSVSSEVPIDCSPDQTCEIPQAWTLMLEKQFAGKDFGTSGFGRDFQHSMLIQVANTNKALEQATEAAQAGRYGLTVEAVNEIIDSYDILGTPSTTRSYVRTMVIATAREDIGRAYLKALQARGQMLGISYNSLTKSLTEVEIEVASAAQDKPAEAKENTSTATSEAYPAPGQGTVQYI